MAAMTFQEYCESKRTAATKKGVVKIPTEISKRWDERVVKGNLLRLGAAAANEYLAFYGKGIGAEKCIHLALKAECEGQPAVARGFWSRAYELETGETVPADDGTGDGGSLAGKAAVIVRNGVAAFDGEKSELPWDLHPGHLATMQPIDAPAPREYYINSPLYIGQPKRDGNRLDVIGEGGAIWYQSKGGNLRRAFSVDAEQGLKAALEHFGPFILDGELFFVSSSGREHRTGAQAATFNITAGILDGQVKTTYGIFAALYFNGIDLRNCSELDRISAGAEIAGWLLENGWEQYFEPVPTTISTQEKQELCDRQKREGREGEVWKLASCRYVGGDDRTCDWVRTKYLTDIVGMVTGLTPTTVAGRPFGALVISLPDGSGQMVSVGSVGTGFSTQQADEMAGKFAASSAGVKVLLTAQGFTEGSKLWQGRFEDFADVSEELTSLPM
jgi:bifunctional non-homologous end joining protein LigD